MRIVITTAGSRGDVAPYLGLARRLQDAGHHAVIATHEPFRTLVESRSIEFAALAGDPRALMSSDEGQRWQRAGTGPLATARLVRLMRPYAREMAEKVMAAAQGADLLLCSSLTSAGFHTAEGLVIPSIGVYLRLFPRVAAVVHHAGAGTSGAGLRHGIPAVPVPLLADQPFWALRLRRLGVAADPLPLARLNSDALVSALHTVLDDPGYRARAKALAERIADEDGAGAVVAAVARL